ncbi:MAG: WbqC family protein [Bacteroidales bacterium]|nr:WbqC family protein [Bacteroidales bacterium]
MNTSYALFSTAYFPPISYVAAMLNKQVVVVEQYETFPKQTYRNRAVVATANGLLPLSVPVIRTNGNHTYTKDMDICYNENWAAKHWRAIESAYNSSPYFLYYKDDVEAILNKKHRTLLELNMDILAFVFKKLKVAKDIILSTDFVVVDANADIEDYRNRFSPKNKEIIQLPPYDQVFEDRYGFQQDLSILDLLFNMGPDSLGYLKEVPKILG